MEKTEEASRWPPGICLSVLGALVIGIFGGVVALFYVVATWTFGAGGFVGLLTVVVCAGLTVSAVAMAKREAAGRIGVSVLGACLVPALPLFAGTYIQYTGHLDPVWWLVAVAVAGVVVAPAWLPGANRRFATGAKLGG